MNDTEKAELKEKIRQSMVDHLTTVGYPNISNEQIIRELRPMWIKLEEANLIVEGMSFLAFQAIANDRFMVAEIEEFLDI